MSFLASFPLFIAKNHLTVFGEVVGGNTLLIESFVILFCVGVSSFSALQQTFDSCSSHWLLIFRKYCGSCWDQRKLQEGFLLLLIFSPVFLGSSLKIKSWKCGAGSEKCQHHRCHLSCQSCSLMSRMLSWAHVWGWLRTLGWLRSCSRTMLSPQSPCFHCSCLSGSYLNILARLWLCFHPVSCSCRPWQRQPWLWSQTVRLSLVGPWTIQSFSCFHL